MLKWVVACSVCYLMTVASLSHVFVADRGVDCGLAGVGDQWVSFAGVLLF